MNIDRRLHELERATYRADYPAALDALVAMLSDLEGEQGAASGWTTQAADTALDDWYTRLATVLTVLCTNPACVLTHADFGRLRAFVATVAHVFDLSGFRTADHVLELLFRRGGGQFASDLRFLNKSDARKFLLCCSLYSRFAYCLSIFLDRDPQSVQDIVLRAQTVQATADAASEARRVQLLDGGGVWQRVQPRPETWASLHLWSLSSYSASKGKQTTRANLNQMIRNGLLSQAVPELVDPPEPARDIARPMVVVACEVVNEAHAVSRCFLAFLRQLRLRFRVVALVAEEDRVPEAVDWADEVLAFPAATESISSLAQRVLGLQPSLLLFPSLGMRRWTLQLSNLRLAPLQVALPGHPDSTQSSCIDCLILGHEMPGDPDQFRERLVLLRSPGNLYTIPRGDEPPGPDQPPAPSVPERPSPLRLATCVNQLKLNSAFVSTCRSLLDARSEPLELHFFPNALGLRYQVTRRHLESCLGRANVRVHPRTGYATYRRLLGACDVYLSPFPFGGENSTLDAALEGLPPVTLTGTELASRLDARVIRLLGLPDWLMTDSPSSYAAAVRRLCGDADLRQKLSSMLTPAAIRQRVSAENARYATDFVDTLWWLHTQWPALRASAGKVLRPPTIDDQPA